ncbi:MAG TPA: tripartite tricarboxylate transporter substrate binding protein [Burkholderiales bacterium]|nr:tripartite tricarboxylate transporter substrate binding protein [Burkholderiales bacterium]
MLARRILLFALASLVTFPVTSMGQTYPDRVVRIYNPFSAGGTSDILSRIVATGLQEAFGQPFVVEAKPGAGGNIALEAVSQARPDGYTLVMAPAGMTVATSLFKLNFNPTRDLAPVVLVGKAPSLLVVPAQSSFRSLNEITEYARANPGKLNYASFGVGTTPHLFMEMLLTRTGVTMQHVPYKGAGPAVTDLIGGQVQLAFQTAAAVLPHVQQGRLRALATSSAERYPGLPSIPSIAELGLAGFDESAWFGIVAPRDTPPAVVQKLNAEAVRILQRPDVRKQLDTLGVVAAPMSAEAFGKFIAEEETKWTGIIRKLGLKPE